jgi:phenylacetate-CoA ligase
MFDALIRDQKLPPEELETLQAERAIRHARFAMENTRFYRDKYSAAGFTLDDLRDPAAFSSLPVIEKADVRDHFADFRSTEATSKNSKISASGGEHRRAPSPIAGPADADAHSRVAATVVVGSRGLR